MRKFLIFVLSAASVISLGAFVACNNDDLPEENNKEPGYGTLLNEFSTSVDSYKVYEGEADEVYDEEGNELTVNYIGGATFVSASCFTRSGVKTFKVVDGEKIIYQKVIAATYINTPEDFFGINANLDGYYVLQNDVNFSGSCTMFGKAPLVCDEATTYNYDVTGKGSSLAQVGVPFTGTFDGNGYSLINYNIAYSPAATSVSAYGMGIFEYVGESAYVGNFNLKGASLTAGYYGGLIAGVNFGTISDVVIYGDCTLTVEYVGAGAVASYNAGTVRNVESYAFTCQSKTGEKELNLFYGNGGTATDCYIGAPYAVEYKAEKDELKLTEGVAVKPEDIAVSVIYSDGSYSVAEILRTEGYDPEGKLNVAQEVKLYYGNGESDYITVSVTPIEKLVTEISIADRDYETEYEVNSENLDLTGLFISVLYNNGKQEDIQVTDKMLDMSDCDFTKTGSYEVYVNYGGATCSFVVNVIEAGMSLTDIIIEGAPDKTEYPIFGSVTIEDLEGLTLKAVYSDGSTLAVGITLNMLDYDFTAKGTASISISYKGKTASVPVEVYDYAVELSVSLKGESRELTYSAGSLPDFTQICNFNVTMASGEIKSVTEIVADKYSAGVNSGVEFSYGGVKVESNISFEIWYVITQASEWSKINNNLAGYYRLGGNLTLDAATSAVIGVAPLNLINADDGYEINIEGTERAGVPFTGKFDGCGYTVYGFYTKYSGGAFELGSYALVPFGYIGEDAYVGNFTLAGASITCGQAGSFIAGLNLGTIDNVTIAEDCYLYVYYGESVPVAAVVNGGTVSAITCCVELYYSYKNFGEYGGSGPLKAFVKQNLKSGTVTDDCKFLTSVGGDDEGDDN